MCLHAFMWRSEADLGGGAMGAIAPPMGFAMERAKISKA